jgi:hypothetical protein
MSIKVLCGALVATTFLFSDVSQSEDVSNPHQSLSNGHFAASFRLRSETVDMDNATNDDAHAFTLRTRINYQSAQLHGFEVFFEFDDVTELGDGNYPTSKFYKAQAEHAGKAVIADPEGTEVNQAYLSFSHGTSKAKYGRQRILLDNQRFVGGVGFRQNEQTYDGFLFSTESIDNTKIIVARVNNVNRIFGEDDPVASDVNSKTDFINVKYSTPKLGSLVAYAYLIDEVNTGNDYDNYGLRFSGEMSPYRYSLEWAEQRRKIGTGLSHDARYFSVEVDRNVASVNVLLGFEQLGSDAGDYGFSTPLATAHKFQGWADQFLATPKEGVNDAYIKLSTKISGFKLSGVYHQFSSDRDNASDDSDLGREFDFVVSRSFKGFGLSLKYASYLSGDDSFNKTDAQKLWLTASTQF